MCEKKVWGKDKLWQTKPQFFNYIRGCLRKAWNRHPNKIAVLKSEVIKIDNPNISTSKRFPKVNGYICGLCNTPITQKQAVVDHINPVGSLQCSEDIRGFVERLLFVEQDDLRVICKKCNEGLAYADKHNLSFEDSLLMKKVIEFEKTKSVSEQILKFNEKPAKNAKLRREQLFNLLKKEEIK